MPAVAKSAPSASTSSSSASDALTNLTRAATIAFTAVQEQAQAEIAQARAERDDAIKALHEAQLDAKDLDLREEGWRAALEKSNLTIKHQAETIEQLRNEVDQWKTQLTRLEESSRQEIEDWKEQYRRAESERARLSARLDDLVAGQLAWNAAAHAYSTPYTPRVAYTEIPEPSTSATGPKRASTTAHPRRTGGTPHGRIRGDSDETPPTTTRKTKTIAGSSVADRVPTPRSRGNSPIRSTAGRRKDQVAVEVPRVSGGRPPPRTTAARPSPARREPQAHAEPRQQLIRRVTAVVDVKEEEPEDGFGDHESVGSGSVYEPEDEAPPIPPSGRRRRASNASTRRKQAVQEWDEDEQTPEVGEDEDEYEEEPEDEDDELLLAPKASKSLAATAKQARGGGAGKPPGRTPQGLKRKIDADASAASGRGGPAKAAKTRRE
ncbi:hypothetical protein OH77DRAFT_1422324 [Trametes cingulata]|nr:hypothetical protein OH77DRAFT_1422324 [Trametes cingulata]